MKKNLALLIIIILIILTGFSLSRYLFLQKESLELRSIIKDNKAKIDELAVQLISQKELNDSLRKEKEDLSLQIKQLSEEIKQQEQELAQTGAKFSDIEIKMNLLKKENIYLSQLRQSFDSKIAQLEKQNSDLQGKFNSIEELKKAIVDLKTRMRQERPIVRKARKVNKVSAEAVIEGNRGFITWRGQPTLKNKVKIEVTPAS